MWFLWSLVLLRRAGFFHKYGFKSNMSDVVANNKPVTRWPQSLGDHRRQWCRVENQKVAYTDLNFVITCLTQWSECDSIHTLRKVCPSFDLRVHYIGSGRLQHMCWWFITLTGATDAQIFAPTILMASETYDPLHWYNLFWALNLASHTQARKHDSRTWIYRSRSKSWSPMLMLVSNVYKCK